MNDKNTAGLRWCISEWESLWEPMIESTPIAFGVRKHQIRIYSDILGQKAWLSYFILSPDAYAPHICHDGNVINYSPTERDLFNPKRTRVVAKDYSRVFVWGQSQMTLSELFWKFESLKYFKVCTSEVLVVSRGRKEIYWNSKSLTRPDKILMLFNLFTHWNYNNLLQRIVIWWPWPSYYCLVIWIIFRVNQTFSWRNRKTVRRKENIVGFFIYLCKNVNLYRSVCSVGYLKNIWIFHIIFDSFREFTISWFWNQTFLQNWSVKPFILESVQSLNIYEPIQRFPKGVEHRIGMIEPRHT